MATVINTEIFSKLLWAIAAVKEAWSWMIILLLIHLNYPGDVAITINNSAIAIIFNTTSKLLGKKSQSGIALTLFIEIMDKELLKYEVKNITW